LNGVLDQIGLDDGDAVCLDHEEDDGEPATHIAMWGCDVLEDMRRRFAWMPILYTFPNFAEAGNCAGMGDHQLWISDPNNPAGKPRVRAPFRTWDIHQYSTSGDIDRDVADYANLAAMAAAQGIGQAEAQAHRTDDLRQLLADAELPSLATRMHRRHVSLAVAEPFADVDLARLRAVLKAHQPTLRLYVLARFPVTKERYFSACK
jgi:hypothetical protein